MDLLRLICFVSFLLASLAIGLRLLWLARKSRQVPELAVAVAFLAGGFLGYGLVVLWSAKLVPPDAIRVCQLASLVAIDLGAMAMALFTFRVFRPEEPLALLALAVLGMLLGMGLLCLWLAPGGDPAPIARELSFWGTTTGTLLAYGWASSESFAFYAVMRRRRRVGLGDPLVTNRLLLWGISWSSSALISAIYIAVHLSGQRRPLGPVVSIVSSILILVAALGAWLAFFPPAPYRRRIAVPTEA